ncbi:ROK family transcriptional regulator [Bifidobacterium lemurum]|uniref:ROK family transcriptional regulator n=1 Tax=Bifidobacterium lemurum TaxID=1603886 RepID=A0A261FQK9_9BIFI|nr:ROK family protein [Bifidobacterium lemurum]OZG61471.1 ROK family transcriptional regulator [Bifidobacterium lemurum]QOL35106.1 ROK family protein [Bifidobacterium lemurum]
MNAPRAASKADPSDIRVINRLLMFDLLFPQNRMSRAELGRQTGLSRVAASEAASDMLDKAILRESGTDEREGRGKRGRLLTIDPDVWRIVSIDLSQPYVMRGALVNLQGHIVHRMELPLEAANTVSLDDVIDTIRELIDRASDHVLGIGISIPGVVTTEGRVMLSANLGWKNLELRDLIEGEFGVHTRVCNDANTALLAERFLGDGSPDSLFIQITSGIGAAVLVDDKIVYGIGHAAGEIGHVVVEPNGPECPCGKRGCLETLISAPVLHAKLINEPDQRQEILTHAGELLGTALSMPTSLLDLSDVAIYGPADIVGETFLSAAEQTVNRLTSSQFHTPTRVRRCEQGDDIVLLGQAVAVMQARVGRL